MCKRFIGKRTVVMDKSGRAREGGEGLQTPVKERRRKDYVRRVSDFSYKEHSVMSTGVPKSETSVKEVLCLISMGLHSHMNHGFHVNREPGTEGSI